MENSLGLIPESNAEEDDDDSSESSWERKDSGKKSSKEVKRPSLLERAGIEKPAGNPKDKKSEIGSESETKELEARLAADEKVIAGQEIVQAESADVNNELSHAAEGSLAEAELLASAALLERIDSKLDQGDVPNDEMLDQAVAETAEELGIELPEEDVVDDEADEELSNQPELSEDPAEDDDPTATAANATTSATTTPVTPAGSASPPPPPPSTGAPAGPGTPPMPPHGAHGSGVPPYTPAGGGPGAAPGPNLNASPNVPPVIIERHSAALPYLVAGYLLGRRKGRIKTEKKLLPIQHKLEKEVADLHTSIIRREEKIRSIVREKVAEKPAAAGQIINQLDRRRNEKLDQNSLPGRRHEKLGKMLVAAERPGSSETAQTPVSTPRYEQQIVHEKPEKFTVPERPKLVEAMTVGELLRVAEHITVEQSDVKRLFETNRLNEEGLRRVTRAYLRGERYERVLRENLQTPPENYELDRHNPEAPGSINQPDMASPAPDNLPAQPAPSSQIFDQQNHTAQNVTNMSEPVHVNSSKHTKQRNQIAVSAVVIMTILALVYFLLR